MIQLPLQFVDPQKPPLTPGFWTLVGCRKVTSTYFNGAVPGSQSATRVLETLVPFHRLTVEHLTVRDFPERDLN